MKLDNGIHMLTINGIKHWIKVDGADHKTTPLVIIHGGPSGNQYTFERTAGPLLAEKRTVVYYEQRGSGRSDKPASDDDYSIDLLVSDFRVLMEELGVEKVDLLGYSFGGELALEIACAQPDSINKLVLSGPSLMYSNIQKLIQVQGFMSVATPASLEKMESILTDNQSLKEKYNAVWSIVDTETVDRFLFENQTTAAEIRKLWEESGLSNSGLMMKALQNQPPQEPLIKRLDNIHHETLIITGVHDRNTGLSVSKIIERLLPNTEWELFNNSAHFPDLEETEKFVDVTTAFLR